MNSGESYDSGKEQQSPSTAIGIHVIGNSSVSVSHLLAISASSFSARFNELTRDGDEERLRRAPCLGVALSARRNLCVHPQVSRESDRDKIDEKCRKLTAPWVRRKEGALGGEGHKPALDLEDLDQDSDCKLCPWYERLDRDWAPDCIPADVYTVDELKRYGMTGKNPISIEETSNPTNFLQEMANGSSKPQQKFCPYFAARRLANVANILILNYQYVLDPRVAQVDKV